jgi:hypothetical protein
VTRHVVYQRMFPSVLAEGVSPTEIDLSATYCSCKLGESHSETDAQYERRYRKYRKEHERNLIEWGKQRCEDCGNLNRNCKCEEEEWRCCCCY